MYLEHETWLFMVSQVEIDPEITKIGNDKQLKLFLMTPKRFRKEKSVPKGNSFYDLHLLSVFGKLSDKIWLKETHSTASIDL